MVSKCFVARLKNTLHNNRQYKKLELQTWIHSQQQGRIQKYIILFIQISIQLLIQLTVATVLKINIFFSFWVLCMSILCILNVKHKVHANLNLSSLIDADPRRPNTSPKFYCRGSLFLQSILTNFVLVECFTGRQWQLSQELD